jgi:Bacterial pre-peptidase C-terminal domain
VTLKDFVGNGDTQDYYGFSLTGSNNAVSISLKDLTADADVYVSWDANNNGMIDAGESISYSYNAGTTPETVYLQGLGAGSYLVDVLQYSGNTNYTLGLTTLSGNNGTSLTTPTDLGTMTTQRTVSGSLAGDGLDFYRFSLDTTSNLIVNLSGLSSPANGLLVRDTNNNGILDTNDTIAQMFSGNSTVNLTGLTAGNYFVSMFRNGADTSYTLSLRPDTAGNTLFAARDLGTLIGGRVVTDSLGANDGLDYYRFTLTTASTVDITLGGLGADLDLAVIRDYNGNGGVDAGEVLLSSINRNTQPDRVTGTLAAGTYYIQVNPYNGAGSAYKLDLGITPV